MGQRLAGLEGYPYVAARSEWGKVLGAAFSFLPYGSYPITYVMRIYGGRLWWTHKNRELLRMFRRKYNNRALAFSLGMEVATERFERDGIMISTSGSSLFGHSTCPLCDRQHVRIFFVARPVTENSHWCCGVCMQHLHRIKPEPELTRISNIVTSLMLIPDGMTYAAILRGCVTRGLMLAARAKSPVDYIREIVLYNILMRVPPNIDNARLCDLRSLGLTESEEFLREWPEYVYEYTFSRPSVLVGLQWLERLIADGLPAELPEPQIDATTRRVSVNLCGEW